MQKAFEFTTFKIKEKKNGIKEAFESEMFFDEKNIIE